MLCNDPAELVRATHATRLGRWDRARPGRSGPPAIVPRGSTPGHLQAAEQVVAAAAPASASAEGVMRTP